MPSQSRKASLWLLFGAYCLMLLWLLFLHRMDEERIPGRYNLLPWDTVNRYFWVLRHSSDPLQRRYAIANLVGNVALFLPLGIFLPALFPKLRSFAGLLLTAVALVMSVEFLQFGTGLGALDVDDLTLNLLGILPGYVLWRIIWGKSGKT